MLNLDLFNEVAITVNDINLWLSAVVPHLSNQRRTYYVSNNNVDNKIKLSKLDGSFEKLITLEPEPPIEFELFKTKYKCDKPPKRAKCTQMCCTCNRSKCKFNQYIKRRARNRRYYQNKLIKLNQLKEVLP